MVSVGLVYLKGVIKLKMPKRTDRKIFTRTAAKSKKVNIAPKIFRGGIRL